MTVALVVLASLLGLAALGSAVQKLRRDPKVMATMNGVGVGDAQVSVLAVLEILGALGLLLGIWIAPVGIAAAVGLTGYFLGAVVAHIRVKAPVKEAVPAVVLTLVALATAVLEVSR